MIWAITAITFVAIVGISGALLFAFLPTTQAGVAERISRFLRPSAEPEEKPAFREKQKARLGASLASVGSYLPARGTQSATGLLLLQAGFRRPNALMALRGVKLLLPFIFLALVYGSGYYQRNPLLVPLAAVIAGYILPDFWLKWRCRRRKRQLQKGLPDCLDLLVVCIEAGLGLDQAMLRVSQELRIAHPQLSDELQMVNLEMRVGKTRLEALRELARRTGLDDIKALVAMLIQTDRFGTSIAQSLRVHADDLRMKRRQRAEEAGAKTSVKMVPALVFFIFPALMIVILGPAAISLINQLGPAVNK
jgi:tight adherence protein C